MSAPTTTNLQELRSPREASMPAVAPGFGSLQSFELMQRAARLLSASTLVPSAYRQFNEKKQGRDVAVIENPNAVPNCVVALNMAQRMGADPLMVMQNLYIVEGRPSWSSQWIIAAINGCGRFSPLRFDLVDLGQKEVTYTSTEWVNGAKQTSTKKITINDKSCVAWAIEKETGERITSPKVTVEMAVKEGWYQKNGSKWQTMDEIMLRYRTASFFGKLYSPELLMGLQSVEEIHDIIDAQPDADGSYSVQVESLRAGAAAAAAAVNSAVDAVDEETGEVIETPQGEQTPEPAQQQPEQQPQQAPRRQRQPSILE